ncbi:hypothetical protein [Chryseolinea lacunae]|uniref:Uncharacterized protein n=1 Tax=Chryseolinea lacunae TaxID=2801331 RepID=A0ABS1KW23_9BACT|nr:hypothetical protein [Chryseolinea lacunae]MBL0743604.1 hypothetical protein [Chryseolinea lacunae]
MERTPRDVERDFKEIHIEKTWAVLGERFSFNLKAWKQDFSVYCKNQTRNISEPQAFSEFGKKKIEPLLNTILKREQYHPTWANLMRWIAKRK